jgi:beta-galactosidase
MKTATAFLITSALIPAFVILPGCTKSGSEREELSLNGIWEMAQTGTLSSLPQAFDRTVPVPGLIDMADPAVEMDPGGQYDSSLFWYRKTFPLDAGDRQVVQLKINKAKYFTRVYLNGQLAGESPYCFVPLYFDLKPYLNSDGKDNELVISVGCRNHLPDTVTNGWDFEKLRYIPGIYDDVKIILSGRPLITNVQVVPLMEDAKVRIVTTVEPEDPARRVELSYRIRESDSGKQMAEGTTKAGKPDDDGQLVFDFSVPMPGFTPWTPEHPFLYELVLSTDGDNLDTKFGMRSFTFDPGRGMALLNGEPYYMRGTNVCIFRFFEDPGRAGLPWNREWIARLHGRFKEMHWNSIRYCIGFPPESWYEVADSIGFLIQDEYPIWTLGERHKMGGVTPRRLSLEYLDWMRERWNHPCVVIWDAQNESVTDVTGKAIRMVRHHDLSNRPWDNGWAAPQAETDAIESHPYRFSMYQNGGKPSEAGPLKDHFSKASDPDNGPNERSPAEDGERYENAVIINEYAWIWLNRNGTPTTLTDGVYETLFPWADTPAERYITYARHLGMMTEYWRAHRQCAGVLHFCGLGYSRPEEPRGQTSDNFTDIRNLTFESQFYKYVRPAFSPVALMLDLWDQHLPAGQPVACPLYVINDGKEEWEGEVRIYLQKGEDLDDRQEIRVQVPPHGRKILSIQLSMPAGKGPLQVVAEIRHRGEKVSSIRDIILE